MFVLREKRRSTGDLRVCRVEHFEVGEVHSEGRCYPFHTFEAGLLRFELHVH